LAELRAEVAEAQEQLLEPEGEAGQERLLQRGLEPRTWLLYGLGYRSDEPVPGTKRKMRAAAIVLPWQDKQGRSFAARYRFIEVQRRTEPDGKVKELRLVSRPKAHDNHAPFAGQVFGWQGLPDWAVMPIAEGELTAHRLCTLIIVEGEINAMSCQQVAGDTHLHVLSIGSEGGRITPEVAAFAQRYGQVLVWADREAVAKDLAKRIPGAIWIKSPDGKDANDLLREGNLGAFLAMIRIANTESQDELEGILWDLYDAATHLAGIDSGSAAVLKNLATRLGKEAAIYEPQPGRWITP
jgi:hypothetical protein